MNKIILLFSLALLLSGCNRARQEQGREDDDVTIDLPQLKAQGEITAVTLYSSTSYFQYKMQPMGYEYELIKDFARSEGLKLNIKVAESPAKLIEMLEAGEADVVAYPIQISNRMKEKLIYCGREEQDCQMLIQRANKGRQGDHRRDGAARKRCLCKAGNQIFRTVEEPRCRIRRRYPDS